MTHTTYELNDLYLVMYLVMYISAQANIKTITNTDELFSVMLPDKWITILRINHKKCFTWQTVTTNSLMLVQQIRKPTIVDEDRDSESL